MARRAADCSVSVAVGGWPSRARSPRYIDHVSAGLADCAGAAGGEEQATRSMIAAALLETSKLFKRRLGGLTGILEITGCHLQPSPKEGGDPPSAPSTPLLS